MTLPFSIEDRPGGEYYIAYHGGGGHMADLPCRCLIAENRALAKRADAAEAEVEALKHDIERHIAIASSEADYAEKLHKALHALTYSVGLIVDRWNVEHPNVPHPETKRIAAAREVLATPSAPKGPQQTTGEGTE